MTTFNDRERGYEAHFALDQEQEFKAEVRRDRAIGQWAGERMGLSGEALTAYAQSVVRADLKEPGDDDVFVKITADLAEKGVEVLPSELRKLMDEMLATARLDVKAGR